MKQGLKIRTPAVECDTLQQYRLANETFTSSSCSISSVGDTLQQYRLANETLLFRYKSVYLLSDTLQQYRLANETHSNPT